MDKQFYLLRIQNICITCFAPSNFSTLALKSRGRPRNSRSPSFCRYAILPSWTSKRPHKSSLVWKKATLEKIILFRASTYSLLQLQKFPFLDRVLCACDRSSVLKTGKFWRVSTGTQPFRFLTVAVTYSCFFLTFTKILH